MMKLFGRKSVFVALLFASACAAGGAVAQSSGNYTPPNPYDPAKFNVWQPRTAGGALTMKNSAGTTIATVSNGGIVSATDRVLGPQAGLGFGGGGGVPNLVYYTAATSAGLDASGSGATLQVKLQGATSDGATAVGVVINNSTTLANAGAKLVSVQNNGTEELYVDKAGSLTNPQTGAAFTVQSTGSGVNASFIAANIGKLQGNTADGGTATATVLNSGTTLANAAAKIVSVQNNGTEKANVLFDGTVSAKNLRAFASGGLLLQDSAGTTIANFADSATTMIIGRAAADQAVQFPGGVNIGNTGSTVLNHTRVTVTLDFPSHGPANQSSLTVTWGGNIALKTTDSCHVTTNFGSQNAVNQCYVSTAGGAGVGVITVLEYCLNGAAGTCDTLSKSYFLDVDVY